ncbi:MAG: 4-hydroxy-tetrahydrodipicolinate reductase [Myxococcales bacterium]|nr:4-hydroxy-tetrahydrodipicolinate reductase [Myxococcales bacterium]
MTANTPKLPIQTVIVGASGRMGLTLQQCLREDSRFETAALLVREESAQARKPSAMFGLSYSTDLASEITRSTVVIDFSLPEAFDSVLHACVTAGAALVCGTTGLTDEQRRSLAEAGESIPVLYAPNMSVGVQVMLDLVRAAAQFLGPDYDIELSETHHRFKKDAPSGTARRLLEALEQAVNERDGKPSEIPWHSIRGGDVVGDHSVFFMGLGDRIEITHRATDRSTFAKGALRAAAWLHGRPPGRYSMADVLAGE